MTTLRASSPRFAIPETLPPFQFQDDDDRLVFHICNHNLIRADTIKKLFPHRSEDRIGRRLNALRKLEEIQRLTIKSTRSQRRKNYPFVYAPLTKGVRRVNEKFGTNFRTWGWADRNNNLTDQYIKERSSITAHTVAHEASVQQRADISFLSFKDILTRFAPASTTNAKSRHQLRVPVKWNGHNCSVNLIPDDFIGHHHHDHNDFFFTEIDEGTETIAPGERRQRAASFFNDTSLLQKFVVYASAFRDQIHKKKYGIDEFRVITKTTTPARAEKMFTTLHPHVCEGSGRVAPGLFLFTDQQTLEKHDHNIFDVPFRNMAGREVRL